MKKVKKKSKKQLVYCNVCKKRFYKYGSQYFGEYNFCSQKCYSKKRAFKKLVYCAFCKNKLRISPFKAKSAKNHFCNINCLTNWRMKRKKSFKCSICGKIVTIRPSDYKNGKTKCCSIECKGKLQSKIKRGPNHPNWKKRIVVKCSHCKKQLKLCKSELRKNNFCNKQCQNMFQKGINSPGWGGGKIKVKCYQCKKEVYKQRYELKRMHRLFCSKECYKKWRRGYQIKENHPSWKGGPLTIECNHCGKIFERCKGHTERNNGNNFCSTYCRNTWMSENLNGENAHLYGVKGKDHPSWRGGLSFEPYTPDFNKDFKERIKQRDTLCCTLCHCYEDDLKLIRRWLCVHHIDYNKKNTFPQNCITLCNRCNALVNFNRESWKIFFYDLLKKMYGYEYTLDQKIILNFIEGDNNVLD